MKKFFELLSSWKFFFLSAILYSFSQFAVVYLGGFISKYIFPLQLTKSGKEFQEIISSWPPGGVQLYLNHLYYDYFHAVVYTLALASALALSLRKSMNLSSEKIYKAVFLAAIPGLFDWIENTIHLSLLRGGLSDWEFWVQLSFSASLIKWISVALILSVSIGGLVIFSFRGRSR